MRHFQLHLSECDGPPRASVATAQYEAHMCTAEVQVTHSLCTDMTARPIRLNASGLTMRQHVQHPNQMQYTTACSQHDGSPRVHRHSQPCGYVHTLAREHLLSECTATAAHIVHEHHSLARTVHCTCSIHSICLNATDHAAHLPQQPSTLHIYARLKHK